MAFIYFLKYNTLIKHLIWNAHIISCGNFICTANYLPRTNYVAIIFWANLFWLRMFWKETNITYPDKWLRMLISSPVIVFYWRSFIQLEKLICKFFLPLSHLTTGQLLWASDCPRTQMTASSSVLISRMRSPRQNHHLLSLKWIMMPVRWEFLTHIWFRKKTGKK